MKNIYELIETLSVRTAMYTGEHKLSNIRSFIDGYTFAMEDVELRSQFLSDFGGFHDWVAEKLGFSESTAGWQNMILAIEMGIPPKEVKWTSYAVNASEEQHKSSVARFFDLVSEYKRA